MVVRIIWYCERRHHVYKAIWMPHIGQRQQLSCEDDNEQGDLRGRLHDTESFQREKIWVGIYMGGGALTVFYSTCILPVTCSGIWW